MNKAELVSAVAEKAGLTKVQATEALNAFMEVTADTLKKGDKIALVGFGTFSVAERAERKARNPQTGKEMVVPAKKVVKFKAGKDLL